MGIVASQSIKNTIITYVGFGIGAINTLFLYTYFLTDDYFGLVGFILSTANLMMPILMFGVSNSIIKFYSSFKSKNQQNSFLTFMFFLPLVIIIPLGLIGNLAYETISIWLSKENSIIENYTWYIYVIAIAMAYFEVFFSWSKVHFKSVFGSFMKEVFHRVCIMSLLLAVYFKKLTVEQFIFALVLVYIARTLIIKIYAFTLRFPKLNFSLSFNYISVLKYSFLIIIAGSVSMLLLDLDKFMLGKLIAIDNIAYYSVAIFIATVIAVPARAMHQITHPLTAKFLNDNNTSDLAELYKKSSLNLFIVGGLVFTLIVTNINMLYTILPNDYSQGLFVVIIISIVKLLDNLLGNNNAILFNSNYYKIVLVFGVIIVVVAAFLNYLLIPEYKIEGAAFASFIALIFYDVLKLWYVNLKFKIQPFSIKTFYTFLLILVLSFSFYFWEFPFHPILNIAMKSIIVCFSYGLIVYIFNFSEDITRIINNLIRRK